MKIQIKDLTFKCIIGMLDFERIQKQRINVNISFEYDYSKDYFIDYAIFTKEIKKFIKKNKFILLETAIEKLIIHVNSHYKVKKLKISLTKPDILKNATVTISN